MSSQKHLILATKPFANEFRLKSWYYTISTLLLLTLALCASYFAPIIKLKIVASILSGLLLVRMFVIYHDHQHHSILHNSAVAKIIMNAFGLYILAPTSIWKRSHDFHHKHNSKLHVSDIGSFPTISKETYTELNSKQKFFYLLLRHPVNIFLGYITVFMFSFCINSAIKSTVKHWDCVLALLLHVGFGILLVIYGGWLSLFLTLIIPHTVACGLGSYLFYVQHNFPKISFKEKMDWKYENAAIESTSYFKMNFIMKWFTGSIGYHHVHHLNSRIPFYRLEETMNSIPELQNVHTTSFDLREMYACLKLKIWDSANNRMITLKELQSQK